MSRDASLYENGAARLGNAGSGVIGALMVMTAASLWGTLGLFGKALLPTGLTPIELASVRSAIGFVSLGLWLLIRRRRVRIRWRDLPFFAVYGALSVALFQYLYFGAIARTAISVAAALLYTAPAFVVILARVFLKEHVGRLHLAALGMVLAGVLLVTGAVQALTDDAPPITTAAVAFGLGSGFTYGLYTLFGKTALRRYDAISTVFFAFGFGALFLGIAAPPWRPIIAQPGAIPLMVTMGLLPTLVAYLLYIGGLRHLTAGSASMLSSVEPVVAAMLGVIFLNEALGPVKIAGIALIVAAAVVLSRRGRLEMRDARAPG